MIIDRIAIAGAGAYFNANGAVNLAANSPTTSLLPVGGLSAGKQWDIESIEFLIESNVDLASLLKRQGQPIISVRVNKELFPGHFTDPFAHRAYNIAGIDDFKRGVFESCRLIEFDGVTTLVSLGTGACRWVSPWYGLKRSIDLDAVCWELATSRLTPDEAFDYKLSLRFVDSAGVESVVIVADAAQPSDPRVAVRNDLVDMVKVQVEFSANVSHDATLQERHTSITGESVGTPLLQAVNLLEHVSSRYTFFSLDEFLSACSTFERFDDSNGKLCKLSASLNLTATLVFSDRQNVASGAYDYLEIQVADFGQTRVEARLQGEELTRIAP